MTERDSSVTLHKTNVQVIPFWSASLPRGTVGPILRISAFHFSTCAGFSVPFHPRCKSFFLSLKSLKPIEAPFVFNVYFSLSLSLSLNPLKLLWSESETLESVCACIQDRVLALSIECFLDGLYLFRFQLLHTFLNRDLALKTLVLCLYIVLGFHDRWSSLADLKLKSFSSI